MKGNHSARSGGIIGIYFLFSLNKIYHFQYRKSPLSQICSYGIARPHSAVSRAPDSEVRGWYPVWPHTFVSPSVDSRGAVVSCWRKYVHKVLVNRLGGLSLPRKRVVRLTNCPDMTLDVYHGCKTTTQQQLWDFFQETQEWVWNSHGKGAISVRAIEVLL